MNKSIGKKFKNLVKKTDMYGAPIGLRYKSKNTYQTFTGGAFTIVSRILILCFLGYGLNNVYQRKNTITKKTLYRDMFVDKQKIHMTPENVDIGLSLSFVGDVGDATDNIFRYMQIIFFSAQVAYDSTGKVNLTYTHPSFSKCGTDRFGGDQNVISTMGLTNYYCDDHLDQYIYGSQTGESNQYGIFIKPCYNHTLEEQGANYTCAPQEAINNAFDQGIATIVIMSSYFDAYEFDQSPIKKQYRTYLYSLGSGMAASQDIYLQENELLTYDSQIGSFFGGETHKYLDVVLGNFYGGAAKTDVFTELSVYFMISSHSDSTIRTVRSIMDCLVETGGLSNVILLIAKLSILKLQQQLFYESLIKKIFKVQLSDNSNSKVDESNDNEKSLDLTFNNIGRVQNYLFKSIPWRVKPKINILKQRINQIFCVYLCKKKQKSRDQIIFDNAVAMLDSQFDIVKTMQSVRSSLLFQKILLTKSQRELIPYFKDNIISSANSQRDKIKSEKKSSSNSLITQENFGKFEKTLSKIILNSQTSKVNYKILKELINNNDDEDVEIKLTETLRKFSKSMIKIKDYPTNLNLNQYEDNSSPAHNNFIKEQEKNMFIDSESSVLERSASYKKKRSQPKDKISQKSDFMDSIKKKRQESKLTDAFGSQKNKNKHILQKSYREKL